MARFARQPQLPAVLFWSFCRWTSHLTPKIGDTIDVVANTVRPYGVHCLFENDTPVLLLIADISWVASFASCDQFASVGDQLTVRIRHIDDASGKIAVSIRDRFVNPWANGEFQRGATYNATVIRSVRHADRCGDGPGVLLQLIPGSFAMLCGQAADVQVGQDCEVTVLDSSVERRAVSIAPSNHDRTMR